MSACPDLLAALRLRMSDLELAAARADYYIYVLFRENGVPFYIGKGRGQRMTRHEWLATSAAAPRSRRLSIIRAIQAKGLEVPKIKLHTGLTEAVAFQYERALIAAIGRTDLGEGPLANHTDGGDGASGAKQSPEVRAKHRAAVLGKKHHPESIAKMRKPKSSEHNAALRGKKRSPEISAKITARLTGRKLSPEHLAKMRGRTLSPETVEKMRGRVRTPEHRANHSAALKRNINNIERLRAANIGRKHSPEHIAKQRAVWLGRRHTPESIAKMRKPRTPEQIAKMRGRKLSPETLDRMRESAIRRCARQAAARAYTPAQGSLPYV